MLKISTGPVALLHEQGYFGSCYFWLPNINSLLLIPADLCKTSNVLERDNSALQYRCLSLIIKY